METNALWTEEFRPKSIENYIGNNENVDLIKFQLFKAEKLVQKNSEAKKYHNMKE